MTDGLYGKFKYILYKPSGAEKLPLIVVLHGSGEIGSNLSKLKKREPYISLNNGKCTPDACVLMPQLPNHTWGTYKAELKDLIDHIADESKCDTDNISITGHSLGANGALDMLLAYPDFFTAASILSPCKDYGNELKAITHIPLWFLYGAKETTFRKYAQSMAKKFAELGGEVRETSVPGYGHPIQFTWVSDKYDMFDWLSSFGRGDNLIIDVSKYQGKIDWEKAHVGLDFVILRSSVGVNKDARYQEYVAGCDKYGIPYHAYHYIKAVDETEARNEAKVMADATAGTNPLFYVIDAEWSGIKAADARKICEAFEEGLRHYINNEIRVAVYIGHHLYKNWALDYERYEYVWIPRYGSNDGEPQTPPAYPCDLWQYTSKGKVDGISGNVDCNKLMGTKPMSFFIGGEKTVFTGKELAAYCEEMYEHKDHWAYWYGTYGKKCTKSTYESKKKQYPDHYGSDRTSGYMKDIEEKRRCADCVGMIKSFFWTGNQYDTDPKYATNGCPDKSANGMYKLCKKNGPIKSIPDIPGIVVWKSGHIGVYVGNGYTVEMKGFAYDCVRNKVTKGPWTNWGMLPDTMIKYDDEPTPVPKLGDRDLKKGCEGSDVAELQSDLTKLGYSLPRYGADGDFGSETESAVKAFQTDYGLKVDGVMNVGNDYNVLFKALDDDPMKYKHVEITGGSVNVRSAPGYDSKIYGVAHKGDILPYQGETKQAEGKDWYMVEYENKNAWVSSKYAKLIK